MDPEPQQLAPWRLFVALTVPADVRDAVQQASTELRRSLRDARIAWARPEQFHLTLKFLGNVDAERVLALISGLHAACAGFAPLKLRAANLGFFPSARSPRVIWVGVDDQDQLLARLQASIETALQDFSAEKPNSHFQGHLTLGRVKDIRRHDADTLSAGAAALKSRVFGEWQAETVDLMRSELSPQGARHTLVEAVPLLACP